MTAAPKYGSLLTLHCRDNFACRTHLPWREAGPPHGSGPVPTVGTGPGDTGAKFRCDGIRKTKHVQARGTRSESVILSH